MLETLQQIAALPNVLGSHACECGVSQDLGQPAPGKIARTSQEKLPEQVRKPSPTSRDSGTSRVSLSGSRTSHEERRTEMIRVTAEIGEGALTQRQQITAPSIEQALKMAGKGKPGRRVRLVFPIDPKAFFVPVSLIQRKAA
jgi:hypothetical protein